MLARVLRRPRLVEQVPAALPEAQPIGVVQRVLGVDLVVARAKAVVRLLPARRVHPLQQGIAPELLFLLLRGIGELDPRGSRGKNSFTACLAARAASAQASVHALHRRRGG